MKVLEINATYGYGSTGLIVKDIGELLKAGGDEVRFAYQKGDCNENEGYQIGSPINWKFNALHARLFGMQAYSGKCATKKLLRYIDSEEPDIVHLHNLHANYINLPLLLNYLAQKDIATVVTLHDCWFFTGKCCHFTSVGCEGWKKNCGNCPKLREKPSSLIFDRTSKALRDKQKLFEKIKNLTVVGCSKWIAELAKESAVFGKSRITHIYNGVDTEVFTPKDITECKKKLGISAEHVILGMANKWLDNRNEQVLKTVISNLDENEVLLLIGCTEPQQELWSNNSKVMAVGFIRDRKLLADYYNAADVFVNLTFEDTLPTVNMESVCCGTPVITYDSCGSPELTLSGRTGYVIPQRDSKALSFAIDRVKRGDISREKCRGLGVLMFDKIKRYQDYVTLFHEIITN